MNFNDIIKQLYHYSSYRRLYSYLKHITEYHRIQGSNGLIAASNYIAKVLGELDVDHEIIRVDKNTDLGLFRIPVGWDVFDAELWITKPKHQRLLKLDDHPTMVLAHSPPSNGWIEGELVYVGKGIREEDYSGKNVLGKIVLAHGSPYYVYKEASKRGAIGILYYRRNAPENAVPYAGLFLTINEARNAKAVGLSISNKIAKQLIRYLDKNEKVVLRFRVDAKYNFNPILPVVLAKYDGRRKEGYALTAHICHPKPGAHDNGSGAAALLEAATILANALKKDDKLPHPYYTIYFIWVPEYLGTQGLFTKKNDLQEVIRAAINLDMVGAKPEITGSILHHINSSISKPSYLDPLLEKTLRTILSTPSTYSSLNKSMSIRYDRGPYEGGSDHDVFISYGIPASMLNQWPDKFYHTDMDDLENIDPLLLVKISVAALSTIYFVSSINENAEENSDKLRYLLHITTDYYNIIINERLFMINEKELEEREKIKETLASLFSNTFDDIMRHFNFNEALEFKKKFMSIIEINRANNRHDIGGPRPNKLFHGILSTRYLYDEHRDKILELMELVEKNNKYTTILFREALHLADGKRGIDEIYDILISEYGSDSISRNDLVRFFKILESLGLIELK